MRGNQPVVRFLADDHVPQIVDNIGTNRDWMREYAVPALAARLNGQTVRLEPAETVDVDYLGALKQLADSMLFAYRAEHCEWRLVPNMLAKLQVTKERLPEDQGGFLRRVEHIGGPPSCGSKVEFFRGRVP